MPLAELVPGEKVAYRPGDPATGFDGTITDALHPRYRVESHDAATNWFDRIDLVAATDDDAEFYAREGKIII